MWLKRVEMRDFGPHRKLDLELACGLIGFVGPNGSGKTTIIDGAYACLTNDFSRFDGNKASSRRLGSAPGDESYVLTEWVHKGTDFTIKRSLPEGHSLRIGGGKPVTNSKKIDEALRELLGVSPKMLDLYAFKKPRTIDDFLSATDADRQRSFQQLCGIDYCEKMQAILAKKADILSQAGGGSGDVDAARVRLAEIDAEAVAAGESRTALAARLLAEKSKVNASKIVAIANALPGLRRELGIVRAQVEANRVKLEEQRNLKTVSEASLAAVDKRLAKDKDANDKRILRLSQVSGVAKRIAERNKVRVELAALKPVPAAKPAPSLAGYTPGLVDELLTEKEQLLIQRAELQRHLKIADMNESECPTCGQPISIDQATVEANNAALGKVQEGIADIMARVLEVRAHQTSLAAWERAEAARQTAAKQASADRKRLTEAIAAYSDLPETVEATDTDAAAVEAYKADASKAVRLRTTIGVTATAIAECETAIVKGEADIAAREAAIAADEKASAQHAKASARLAEDAAVRVEMAAIDGQLKALTAERSRLASAIDSAETRRAVEGRKLRLGGIYRRAAEILHFKQLPAKVTDSNMRRIVRHINPQLALFGSPFTVAAEDNLRFSVHRSDSPPMAAGRLSDGLRVVLSISFWLAVASMWQSDIGILALDEPTASLDAANRDFLASALSAFAGSIRGESQVLLVTHADNLRGVFDQTVDLGILNAQT